MQFMIIGEVEEVVTVVAKDAAEVMCARLAR